MARLSDGDLTSVMGKERNFRRRSATFLSRERSRAQDMAVSGCVLRACLWIPVRPLRPCPLVLIFIKDYDSLARLFEIVPALVWNHCKEQSRGSPQIFEGSPDFAFFVLPLIGVVGSKGLPPTSPPGLAGLGNQGEQLADHCWQIGD